MGLIRVLAIILMIPGCDGVNGHSDSSGPAESSSNVRTKIRVVCTTGMVADIVRNVGGDRVEVQQLMGPSVDPHLYKASTGDVSALNSADLICYTGLHLEGKMSDTLGRIARRKLTCVLTDAIPKERLLISDEAFADPHVWLDVSIWALTIEPVCQKLSQARPSFRAEFEARAKSYREQLTRLHHECLEKMGQLSAEKRVLVTAHDAFHYFGRAYGVEVRAIQGISTEGEAGVKQINELVEFISKRKIKAVFTESSVNERNVQSLIEGCGQSGHHVERGGELYSDALGEPGTSGATYVGMIRHNVDTMIKYFR